jgi:hypothetical protein
MSINASIKGPVYSEETNRRMNADIARFEATLPKSQPARIDFLMKGHTKIMQELNEYRKVDQECKELEKKLKAAIADKEQTSIELAKWEGILERVDIIIEKKDKIAIKEKEIAKEKESIAQKKESIAQKKESIAQAKESIARQKESTAQKKAEAQKLRELQLQETRAFARETIGEEVLNDSSFISDSSFMSLNLLVKALDDIQADYDKECLKIGDEGMGMIIRFLQSHKNTNVNLYEFKDEFQGNALVNFFSALPTTKVVSVGILPEQIKLVSEKLKLSLAQTNQLKTAKQLPYKGVTIQVK